MLKASLLTVTLLLPAPAPADNLLPDINSPMLSGPATIRDATTGTLVFTITGRGGSMCGPLKFYDKDGAVVFQLEAGVCFYPG